MTTTIRQPHQGYARSTASMQTDTEAHPTGAASASSSRRAFPIDQARCATTADDLEWVPDTEQPAVPAKMAALCRRCPGRQNCLLWALAGAEAGYWAGTTTADRQIMLKRGLDQVDDADQIQDDVLAARRRGAKHAPGDGSFHFYRYEGCRCGECRDENASRRALERARARARAAA